MALDPRLRSPKEAPLFTIGAIVSAIAWIVCAITIVGLFYAAMIRLFLLMGQALFLAYVKGNGLRLSDRQLPQVYERVKEASKKLGLETVPDVYVLQAGGALNA